MVQNLQRTNQIELESITNSTKDGTISLKTGQIHCNNIKEDSICCETCSSVVGPEQVGEILHKKRSVRTLHSMLLHEKNQISIFFFAIIRIQKSLYITTETVIGKLYKAPKLLQQASKMAVAELLKKIVFFF